MLQLVTIRMLYTSVEAETLFHFLKKIPSSLVRTLSCLWIKLIHICQLLKQGLHVAELVLEGLQLHEDTFELVVLLPHW
jgi:hypothetical protein